MRTSPTVITTMAGTAMAMACWALIVLVAEKTTTISPSTAPAEVPTAPGLPEVQETAWRNHWGNDPSLISVSLGSGRHGTYSSCFS